MALVDFYENRRRQGLRKSTFSWKSLHWSPELMRGIVKVKVLSAPCYGSLAAMGRWSSH